MDPDPSITVRNYSGNIPIHVLRTMDMEGGALVFDLDGAPWGSTISIAPGIPVTLNGNLELDLAAGVNLAGLVGDSFQLFDRTGVSPSGQFATITNDLPAGYSWDTTQLYSNGDVTLVPGPSTFVLLGGAAIGLLGYAWRKWLICRRRVS
ncbi:MAG: hypothetical protein ABSG53_04670 [Thermoguttaceae bacterium]